MFGVELQSSDIIATSYAGLTVATLATAALTLLGLSWIAERWRVAVALAGVALLASAFMYYGATQVWLATQKVSVASRYVAWFTVQPLQVAAVYFYVYTLKPVPAGIFWRMVAAAILMVLSRYFGEAGIFTPTLGVLLSIAFWLYILGEMYFGSMSEVVIGSSRPIRLGYFWIRLILTLGWVIYPILYFADLVVGAGQSHGIVVLYSLADLINLITVSLIVLAVASQERY
jgi:sensory rhodopsin